MTVGMKPRLEPFLSMNGYTTRRGSRRVVPWFPDLCTRLAGAAFGLALPLTAAEPFQTLVSFGGAGAAQSTWPASPLIEASDGMLYGMASGTNQTAVFRLNKDGFLYGTTSRGGESDFGAVVRLAQQPVILSIGVSGPAIQLQLSGIPGRNYGIEAKDSQDPASWVALGVRTAGTNGVFAFDDIRSGVWRGRFYRAVEQ